MAETKGFEPSRRFPAYSLSRGAPSTTRPRLRWPVYPRMHPSYKVDFPAGVIFSNTVQEDSATVAFSLIGILDPLSHTSPVLPLTVFRAQWFSCVIRRGYPNIHVAACHDTGYKTVQSWIDKIENLQTSCYTMHICMSLFDNNLKNRHLLRLQSNIGQRAYFA